MKCLLAFAILAIISISISLLINIFVIFKDNYYMHMWVPDAISRKILLLYSRFSYNLLYHDGLCKKSIFEYGIFYFI